MIRFSTSMISEFDLLSVSTQFVELAFAAAAAVVAVVVVVVVVVEGSR